MEDLLYEPYGGITTCSGLIAMRGGWDQVTAEEATWLARLGCYPKFSESQPYWSAPDAPEMGGGGGYAAPEPIIQPFAEEPTVPEPVAWTPTVEATPVTLGEFFSGSDFETNPVEWTGWMPQAPIGIDPTQIDPSNTLPGQIIRGATAALQASIETGITVQDSRIRGRCAPARRRFKVVRGADGQPTVISVCPPRRMNPCNPRALGRAARRLSMFQRMSSGIEKLINRQLKRRGGSPRSYRCAPKRCR